MGHGDEQFLRVVAPGRPAGHGYAMDGFGMLRYDCGDLSEAREWWERAACAG